MTKIEIIFLSGAKSIREVAPSRAFEALNHFRARWGVKSARII